MQVQEYFHDHAVLYYWLWTIVIFYLCLGPSHNFVHIMITPKPQRQAISMKMRNPHYLRTLFPPYSSRPLVHCIALILSNLMLSLLLGFLFLFIRSCLCIFSYCFLLKLVPIFTTRLFITTTDVITCFSRGLLIEV